MCTPPVGRHPKEVPVELIRRQPQKSGSDIPEPSPNLSVDSLTEWRRSPITFHRSQGPDPVPLSDNANSTPLPPPLAVFHRRRKPNEERLIVYETSLTRFPVSFFISAPS
ncbi:hypothetical protein NPIL_542141 [Nephila pilipes]|uniref:Uncharacterized protein n=1 Tax=Nephila pilipes TaxID=299642 RepID=A0A8X6Q3H8_NEPPI|nr:hypothetical protein NPIL_542141 [Nephila pilipes]